MLASVYLAPWALALVTQAFAEEPAIIARAPRAEATSVVLGTASGGAIDPLATRPAHVGPKPAFAGGPDLTINVVNSFSSPLSIFYGSNAGAPTPVGNPGSGVLTSSTKVLFPSDWAGRITIGKTYDPLGSKIEASYSSPNYVPDVDVSYVDGFSVPISCSCSGVAVTGCNIRKSSLNIPVPTPLPRTNVRHQHYSTTVILAVNSTYLRSSISPFPNQQPAMSRAHVFNGAYTFQAMSPRTSSFVPLSIQAKTDPDIAKSQRSRSNLLQPRTRRAQRPRVPLF